MNNNSHNGDTPVEEPDIQAPSILLTEPENILPCDLPLDSLHILGSLTTEQNERIAVLLWMRGYTLFDIAQRLQWSRVKVLEILKQSRAEMAEWHKDEIDSIRSERIEGFRQVQQRAWREYDEAKPGTKAQLLSIIMKAEESIAKMQGVVEHKVKHEGKLDHMHKLYDFNNSEFPDAEVKTQVVIPAKASVEKSDDPAI